MVLTATAVKVVGGSGLLITQPLELWIDHILFLYLDLSALQARQPSWCLFHLCQLLPHFRNLGQENLQLLKRNNGPVIIRQYILIFYTSFKKYYVSSTSHPTNFHLQEKVSKCQWIKHFLNLCMLGGGGVILWLPSAAFIQNHFSQKVLSRTALDFQMVWTLILVKIVCKCYQQTTIIKIFFLKKKGFHLLSW